MPTTTFIFFKVIGTPRDELRNLLILRSLITALPPKVQRRKDSRGPPADP